MKKLIAKEFLWLLGILLLSFPVAVVLRKTVTSYLESLNDFLSRFNLGEASALMEGELYLIGFAGLYIIRFVSAAISTVVAKEEGK